MSDRFAVHQGGKAKGKARGSQNASKAKITTPRKAREAATRALADTLKDQQETITTLSVSLGVAFDLLTTLTSGEAVEAALASAGIRLTYTTPTPAPAPEEETHEDAPL